MGTDRASPMKPVRSLLYVPANNQEWVESAPDRYNADGYIFDLEDSVPPGEKQNARDILSAAAATWETDAVITVRVNPPDTGYFESDLDAIMKDYLDGIILPKIPRLETVTYADHVLEYLETARGIDAPIEMLALPETAYGMRHAYEVCTASKRINAIVAATSRGADADRALGFDWSPTGEEKRGYLSKLNLDGRAAGLNQIHAGAWVDVEDIDGLQKELELVHSLGYTGYHVIHPSHIEPVNSVFTPDEETVRHAKELIEQLETAETDDRRGAVCFEGEMIDRAHIKYAEEMLERARAFGVLDT